MPLGLMVLIRCSSCPLRVPSHHNCTIARSTHYSKQKTQDDSEASSALRYRNSMGASSDSCAGSERGRPRRRKLARARTRIETFVVLVVSSDYIEYKTEPTLLRARELAARQVAEQRLPLGDHVLGLARLSWDVVRAGEGGCCALAHEIAQRMRPAKCEFYLDLQGLGMLLGVTDALHRRASG